MREDEDGPKGGKKGKTQRTSKDPTPWLTDKQLSGISRALHIWAMIENPTGNSHLGDSLFYDGDAAGYARQGEMSSIDSQRTKNLTHANSVARDEWEQGIFFGEAGKEYTPEGEFYDALVRHRQSQYDVADRRDRKKKPAAIALKGVTY